MAKFEVFDSNDDVLQDFFEIDCPVCGKPFGIPLERTENFIICPNCKSNIEIESSNS